MAKKKKKDIFDEPQEKEISKKIEANNKNDEKEIEFAKKVTKKTNKNSTVLQQIMYILLSIALIMTITYFIEVVVNSGDVIDRFHVITSSAILSVFAIFFVIMGLLADNKRGHVFVIIASSLLSFYSGFNLLSDLNVIKLPNQEVVINLANRSLTEVINWANQHGIEIKTTYEASDLVDEYYIISQDIEVGTLVKKVTTINVVVSSGPDLSKEVVFPNMVGWLVDDVVSYVEENYFTNVSINFIVSDKPKDFIIEQDISGQVTRNQAIILTASIGQNEDIIPLDIIDFTNKSKFYTETWLKRYGIKYELNYEYNDNVEKGMVISQSIKGGSLVDPTTDTVVITISKGSKIIIPDFSIMTVEDITSWVVENKLKISFENAYDDTLALGKVISSNYNKGDVVEEGDLVKIVVSKGQMIMGNFTTASEFKAWALENNINYTEKYEFSDTVLNGEIISSTHKSGDVIKKDDTITITISQGKQITIPNFIGKNKSAITKECSNLGLSCNFVYGNYTESTAKDVALKQSKAAGSKVSQSATVTITLSRGIIEKVNVPSFVGQTKSSVSAQCNNLGITCNFVYQTNYSSTLYDNVVSQSKTGNVNKGSSITVTLSRGPAQSYTAIIQQGWIGDPNALKSKLQNYFSQFSGVTVNIHFEQVNQGIGTILPKSDLKVGSNTITQGKAYNIYIGSN